MYITIEYGTDDISDQAQFYFMTDASPTYSQDKLMTFHICRSRDRYAYKLDLSNLPAWNNIVTMLRLDPVHYPSQYEGEHIHSECSIYSISVSSAPLIYTNEADYTGCQGVNQWEYCSCKDGIVDHLVYNDRKEVWEHQDGTHIGLDFSKRERMEHLRHATGDALHRENIELFSLQNVIRIRMSMSCLTII